MNEVAPSNINNPEKMTLIICNNPKVRNSHKKNHKLKYKLRFSHLSNFMKMSFNLML